MRYERDEEAVRSAREEKKKAEDEIAIANIQKEIDLIQESIDALEKHKEALNEELEAINEYYENLIEETEKMYDQMIKDTESYWQEIIEGLEAVKSKWEELAEIETIASAWGSLGEQMAELGYTVEDVLNDTPGAFEAFKQKYIETLAGANSENQHFLDGLNYATDGAAKAFGQISENAGEIEKSLGKVADATQPLEGAADNISSVGTTAGEAAGNVGTLATKTGELADDAEKIAELAKQVDAVKLSIQNLSSLVGETNNPFTQLTTPLTTLLELLRDISSILDGPSSEGFLSIVQGLTNIGLVKFDEIIAQFTALDDAINSVVTSISGGGKKKKNESNQNGARGANGTGENGTTTEQSEEGSDNLVDAIGKVKEATDTNIGTSEGEQGENAIGSFVALKTAVDNVSKAIGTGEGDGQSGDKKEDNANTLIGAILALVEQSEDPLKKVESYFDDLKAKIQECIDAVGSLIALIDSIDIDKISSAAAAAGGGGGGYTGTATSGRTGLAYASGTALASGSWGTKRTQTALVGELGQEIMVTPDGKYQTIGDHGPEFRKIPKGSIIFNHLQSREILSKKNQIKYTGPAFAQGTLPNGFTALANDNYSNLAAMIKRTDLPTMQGIVAAFDSQTKDIGSMVQNITKSATAATNVSMNNNFNISGVTGEDVARQISSHLQTTFLGLANNTMQYAMTR